MQVIKRTPAWYVTVSMVIETEEDGDNGKADAIEAARDAIQGDWVDDVSIVEVERV